MNDIKGYLIECQGRSLFLREKSDIAWAEIDPEYTVTELVAKDSELAGSEFELYQQLSEKVYILQQEQIENIRTRLEEFVEVVESIVEIAVPTDHLIENKAKLLLIKEACEKLLKSDE